MRLIPSSRLVGRASARLAACTSLAALLLSPAASAQDSPSETPPQPEPTRIESLQPQSSAAPAPRETRERSRNERSSERLSATRQEHWDTPQDRAELIELIRQVAVETGVQEIQQGLAEALLGGSTQFRVTVVSLRSSGMVRVTGPAGLDRQLSGAQLQQVLAGNTSPLGIQLIEVLSEREINPAVFAQQLLNLL